MVRREEGGAMIVEPSWRLRCLRAEILDALTDSKNVLVGEKDDE